MHAYFYKSLENDVSSSCVQLVRWLIHSPSICSDEFGVRLYESVAIYIVTSIDRSGLVSVDSETVARGRDEVGHRVLDGLVTSSHRLPDGRGSMDFQISRPLTVLITKSVRKRVSLRARKRPKRTRANPNSSIAAGIRAPTSWRSRVE